MLHVAKETMGKGKSSKFKLKQQSIRTTSTLLWYLTLYKVTTFLVFVVAKIWFFSREETQVLNAAGICSKWTMNKIEETVEYV